MSPRITIGMATYDDAKGVWATVQSIFLNNQWASKNDVELIIVDTSPTGSNHKQDVKKLCRAHKGLHVELPNVIGTTYPRDHIFSLASAPFTVVMDCHVMCPMNTLVRLTEWFESHPDCEDLIQGPILYDNGDMYTHMADQFRRAMWGTWSNIWQAPDGTLFSCEGEEVTDDNKQQRFRSGKVSYHNVMDLTPLPGEWPDLDWAGHEQRLTNLGYVRIADLDTDTPYEIPGQGMGLFASATKSWLGFAAGCSGFGGEEMNIHTKYRQAGRKAVCLPFLKWNHCFIRPEGVPYPIPLSARVRNYVLWAKELNNPTILERVAHHFVNGGMFPKSEWIALVSDPINYPVKLTPPPRKLKPLDALFAQVATKPRDLNEHAEALQEIAYQSDTIQAIVKRVEWEPILASAFPKKLVVYQTENHPLSDQTHEAVKAQRVKNSRKIDNYFTHYPETRSWKTDFDGYDTLVIDREMRYDVLSDILTNQAPYIKKYIVIRGTTSFGEVAEFDKTHPGLMKAINEFLLSNPDWFILRQDHHQYGMTYLTSLPENRGGPGTELKRLLSSLGIEPKHNCPCNDRMIQMDRWGKKGCEANFDTIIQWLEESAEQENWTKKVVVGWKMFRRTIDVIKPYHALLNQAIKYASK